MPRSSAGSAARSASSVAKATISPVSPAGRVAPLPPSAVSTQRLREGCDDLGLLDAAHPAIGDVERLDMNIGEAQRLQPRHRPGARARLGFAAGEARADLGGQSLDDRPGGVVAERALWRIAAIRSWAGRLRGHRRQIAGRGSTSPASCPSGYGPPDGLPITPHFAIATAVPGTPHSEGRAMAVQYSYVMKGLTKTFPGQPKPVLPQPPPAASSPAPRSRSSASTAPASRR